MDSDAKRTNELSRSGRLTRELWDRLPFLIPLAVVLEWTGLRKHDIAALVREGRIRRFAGVRKGKYYRDEIGRLLFESDRVR